jgi:hypothetical protein
VEPTGWSVFDRHQVVIIESSATNKAHTPTGFVLIEDVIRFCIVDLKVPAKDGWHETLEASHAWFLQQCAD